MRHVREAKPAIAIGIDGCTPRKVRVPNFNALDQFNYTPLWPDTADDPLWVTSLPLSPNNISSGPATKIDE